MQREYITLIKIRQFGEPVAVPSPYPFCVVEGNLSIIYFPGSN